MGLHITLIAVGRLKEKYWGEAVNEYAKRLGRYCTLKIIEVADEKAPEHLSTAEQTRIKDLEGQRILSHIRQKDHVIALAVDGKSYDSKAFSHRIQELELTGRASVVIVIGGSLGLSGAVLDRSDECISFSEMTFPHQLMRVILLEQLYRAYKIMRNEPYHK